MLSANLLGEEVVTLSLTHPGCFCGACRIYFNPGTIREAVARQLNVAWAALSVRRALLVVHLPWPNVRTGSGHTREADVAVFDIVPPAPAAPADALDTPKLPLLDVTGQRVALTAMRYICAEEDRLTTPRYERFDCI